MSALLIGYARCSTDQQDLTAQRDGPTALGVAANRVYVDYADLRIMPTSVAKPLVGKVIGVLEIGLITAPRGRRSARLRGDIGPACWRAE
jgi:hypothetical protein